MTENDLYRMREDVDRLERSLEMLRHEVRELRALVTPLDAGSLQPGNADG